MPSKTIYCKECKGYGETYHQTIERYGDQRIKDDGADMRVMKCTECGGTGYIHPRARKRPDWVGVPPAQRADTNFVVAVKNDTEETETTLL